MSSKERITSETTRYFDEKVLLEELQTESLSIFAGGIVHELNNYLSIILPNLAMAMSAVETEFSDSGLSEDLGEIDKATHRLRAFMDQILMVCQTTDSHLSHQSSLELVRASLKEFQESVPGSVIFNQHLDPMCPALWLEPPKFKQMVVSLCSEVHRSLKNPAGTIEIRMEPCDISGQGKEGPDIPEGTYIKLCIKDGVDETAYQVEPEAYSPSCTLDPISNCTSPGFFVSYCILRLNNGCMTAHQSPSGGPGYTVYWPVEENGKSNAPGGFQDHSVGIGKKILLVEDKVSSCRMIKQFLEDFGFEVRDYVTPAAAWEAFQRNPASYDLILTDYAMPEFSGMELSDRIHRLRDDIPSILMMNLVDVEKRKIASNAGINHLLKKPVGTDELLKVVNELFQPSSGRVR